MKVLETTSISDFAISSMWNVVWNIFRKEIGWALLLILFCQYIIHRTFYKGPIAWPVVGMLPDLLRNCHRIYDWYTETQIGFGGTFRFVGPWMSNMHGIVTADPRNVEYILKTHSQNFPKGTNYQVIFKDLLGEGIFNADHDLWALQRKVASREFYNKVFKDYIANTVKDLVGERLLPVLNDVCEKGCQVDLQNVLLRYTFDSTCIGAFGVNSGCLEIGLPEVPFAKAFETATEATVIRFMLPEIWWKTMKVLGVGMEGQLKEALKTVDQFAAQVISCRKKELKMDVNADNKPSDLLSSFILLRDETGQPYSDKFLRDLAVNLILAGRDTSGVALTWFFWLLSQNPQVEENILRELEAILNRRDSTNTNPRWSFTRDELNEMHYLHAALSETLRLYPSVPLDTKQVLEADVLPDGRKVKPGERLTYCIYSMGRMESIWGEDCLEFKPERWMMDGRFLSQSAYKYTAFNAGPRLCLGKEIAYLQMKAAAAAILQCFKMNLVPFHPVDKKFSTTLFLNKGLLVTLSPRNTSPSY
eukprot:c23202_g1_i1 orf=778-2373(+)